MCKPVCVYSHVRMCLVVCMDPCSLHIRALLYAFCFYSYVCIRPYIDIYTRKYKHTQPYISTHAHKPALSLAESPPKANIHTEAPPRVQHCKVTSWRHTNWNTKAWCVRDEAPGGVTSAVRSPVADGCALGIHLWARGWGGGGECGHVSVYMLYSCV